jgi:hypothetical protein
MVTLGKEQGVYHEVCLAHPRGAQQQPLAYVKCKCNLPPVNNALLGRAGATVTYEQESLVSCSEVNGRAISKPTDHGATGNIHAGGIRLIPVACAYQH